MSHKFSMGAFIYDPIMRVLGLNRYAVQSMTISFDSTCPARVEVTEVFYLTDDQAKQIREEICKDAAGDNILPSDASVSD